MALRPDLYRRLEQRLGDVVYARDGEEMDAYIYEDPTEVDSRGRPFKKLQVNEPGEAYRVNCPFCGDTRKRLWVNHMWGYKDTEHRIDYLWLANCFNDGCPLKGNIQLKRRLYEMIYSDVLGQVLEYDVVLPGVRLKGQGHVEAKPPGVLVPLTHLPSNHPANAYFRDRGYDPAWLQEHYRLRFCPEAIQEYPLVTGRVVIPVYMRGKLVGWQARLLGTPSSKHIPKYYTMPGMAKGLCLYNFDTAAKHGHVVITEGVTDAWRYGPEAVALLGNKATSRQIAEIVATWRHVPVFCMLDGEARDENQALADQLSIGHPNVVRVDLLEDKDPGSCSHLYLRELVVQAAQSRGLDLLFQTWSQA